MEHETDAEAARRRVERIYAGDQVARTLGIALLEVTPGRVAVAMRVRPDMLNAHGTAHGGYLFLLADTAFQFASNAAEPDVVARSAQIEFLRPAFDADELTAVAEERVRRGRDAIYDIRISRAGEVVAEMRGNSRALRR